MAEDKRRLTKTDKFRAYKNVFDFNTLKTIQKLSANRYFDELGGPIKIGKEANVFYAFKGGEKVVLKIYRKNAPFKKMYEYMAPDPRYTNFKKTKIGVIYAWAKKEFRNLLKAREAGLKVPKPIAVKNNVVMMEFIGDDYPAPPLNKDPPTELKPFFETLIKDIKTLYTKAKLVHADLSQYNILNYDEKPVIIDWSHAVDQRYPNSGELLRRDIHLVVKYFNKLGLDVEEEKVIKKCLGKN